MGFQLEQIKPARPSKSSNTLEELNALLKKDIVVLKKAFPNKIKEAFYTELSVLLTSGISLKEALELLKDTQKHKKTRDILGSITNNLVAGQSLSEAIAQEKAFTAYEMQSLKIGEETGHLTRITEQLGLFFQRKNEQRKQIVNALTYPGIIICTAVMVVIFMLKFVVPMFTDIFKQQNVELPAITKFVVGVSEFIGSFGWILVLGILALVIGLPFLNKQAFLKNTRTKSYQKSPYLVRWL